MHQISGRNFIPTPLGRLFGGTSRSNATQVTKEWANAVQQEIIGVLSLAGIAPRANGEADAAVDYASQLAQAVGVLLSNQKRTFIRVVNSTYNPISIDSDNSEKPLLSFFLPAGTIVNPFDVLELRFSGVYGTVAAPRTWRVKFNGATVFTLDDPGSSWTNGVYDMRIRIIKTEGTDQFAVAVLHSFGDRANEVVNPMSTTFTYANFSDLLGISLTAQQSTGGGNGMWIYESESTFRPATAT